MYCTNVLGISYNININLKIKLKKIVDAFNIFFCHFIPHFLHFKRIFYCIFFKFFSTLNSQP